MSRKPKFTWKKKGGKKVCFSLWSIETKTKQKNSLSPQCNVLWFGLHRIIAHIWATNTVQGTVATQIPISRWRWISTHCRLATQEQRLWQFPTWQWISQLCRSYPGGTRLIKAPVNIWLTVQAARHFTLVKNWGKNWSWMNLAGRNEKASTPDSRRSTQSYTLTYFRLQRGNLWQLWLLGKGGLSFCACSIPLLKIVAEVTEMFCIQMLVRDQGIL